MLIDFINQYTAICFYYQQWQFHKVNEGTYEGRNKTVATLLTSKSSNQSQQGLLNDILQILLNYAILKN